MIETFLNAIPYKTQHELTNIQRRAVPLRQLSFSSPLNRLCKDKCCAFYLTYRPRTHGITVPTVSSRRFNRRLSPTPRIIASLVPTKLVYRGYRGFPGVPVAMHLSIALVEFHQHAGNFDVEHDCCGVCIPTAPPDVSKKRCASRYTTSRVLQRSVQHFGRCLDPEWRTASSWQYNPDQRGWRVRRRRLR